MRVYLLRICNGVSGSWCEPLQVPLKRICSENICVLRVRHGVVSGHAERSGLHPEQRILRRDDGRPANPEYALKWDKSI